MRIGNLWGNYIDLDRIISVGPLTTIPGMWEANRTGVSVYFEGRLEPILYRSSCLPVREVRKDKILLVPVKEDQEAYDQFINDWQNKTGKEKYRE